MTCKQKITDAVLFITVGFTIVNGLLSILIFAMNDFYTKLSYHYSNNINWYGLIFGLPFIAGVVLYFWIRKKRISTGIKIIFGAILIFQLSFTVISTKRNTEYWGYPFKRPTVFNELSKATNVIQSSLVLNFDDSIEFRQLYIELDSSDFFEKQNWKEQPYYNNIGRSFMIFKDNSQVHTNNSQVHTNLKKHVSVYYDTNLNIPQDELISIDSQILKTRFIDKGEKKHDYYDHLGQLMGVMTKFKTHENKTYIFAGFQGKEIKNDHYPYYEFLFREENGCYILTKKQKYYTDFAGVEGFEYVNIGPLFSLVLTIVGLVIASIILLISRILKRRNKER